MLRLYKPVPSEPLPMDLAIVPPKIQRGRLSDYAGSFGQEQEWPACSAHTRPTAAFQETWYQVLADAANGDNGRVERLSGPCPIPLGQRGMIVFDTSSAAASTQSFLIARNNNSPYLYYCLDSEGLRRKGLSENNIVLRINGKLPSFPLGLYEGEPAELVPNKEKHDVRYLSFVTVKPLPPFSQYEGIDGQAILDFYQARHGGVNGTWDGRYSLVVSTDPSAPQRCRLFDHDRDIFFGYRQLDGEGATFPHLRPKPFNPSIVYRQLVPKKEGKTALAALDACRQAGRCNDTGLIESVMQEFYPRVECEWCGWLGVSVCLSVCPSVRLAVCPSVCLPATVRLVSPYIHIRRSDSHNTPMDGPTDYVCHSDGRVESPEPEAIAGDDPSGGGDARWFPKPRGGVVGGQMSGM